MKISGTVQFKMTITKISLTSPRFESFLREVLIRNYILSRRFSSWKSTKWTDSWNWKEYMNYRRASENILCEAINLIAIP